MANERSIGLKLVDVIGLAERVAYYVAALFLIATTCFLFLAAAVDLLEVGSVWLLAVLDKVLLIFIFTELLGTITTIVREREVRAELFLLIGLIAVVRRILAVTVSIEQSLGSPEFTSLLYELGVLTALVVVLSGALYFIRKEERSSERPVVGEALEGGHTSPRRPEQNGPKCASRLGTKAHNARGEARHHGRGCNVGADALSQRSRIVPL